MNNQLSYCWLVDANIRASGADIDLPVIKRWSEAESFTIFENHVYRSKRNLMFAMNFEATPFLVGSFWYTSKSWQ